MIRSTRILFQSAPTTLQRSILPPASTFAGVDALRGIWTQLTDATAREKYEKLVSDGVIKDGVLSQAAQGSLLTMALFHNLQNPLWQKYQFDAKEFVETVPLALETYTDTLGCLVSEMNEEDEDTSKGDESVSEKENKSMWIREMKQQDNLWIQQASDDSNSLAGRLSKMTTEHNFQEHWLGANLFKFFGRNAMEYVKGSSNVMSVALLGARVEEVWKDGQPQHPEFIEEQEKLPVAAQINVLYEMQQQYKHSNSIVPGKTSMVEQYNQVMGSIETKKDSETEESSEKQDSTSKVSSSTTTAADTPKASPSPDSPNAEESLNDVDEDITVTETVLQVAVIEAWLSGGPEHRFRWRIARIREAHEFRN